MPLTQQDEKRVLTRAEFDFVKQTRAPAVDRLKVRELRDLVTQIRRYRDKATDIARSQRREMRGKKGPRGATAAAANDAQTHKKQIFTNALKRVNRRIDAMESDRKRSHDLKAAKKALKSRRAMLAEREANPILNEDRTPNRGPAEITNPKGTVFINPMERGRVSQFVRDAQGKRDS